MNAPVILKQNPALHPLQTGSDIRTGSMYRVVIIDNDHNTYDEVISVCMQALQIGFDDAFKIALAVDHNGEAEIYRASREEAERIAGIIRKIGIEVVVTPL